VVLSEERELGKCFATTTTTNPIVVLLLGLLPSLVCVCCADIKSAAPAHTRSSIIWRWSEMLNLKQTAKTGYSC